MVEVNIQSDEKKCELTAHGKEKVNKMHDDISSRDISEFEWVDFAGNYDVEFLGSGAMRAVFIEDDPDVIRGTNDCVIKIEKDQFISGCIREVLNWELVNEIDPEFEDRFAQVYDYDEKARWLTMELIPESPNIRKASEAKTIFKNRGWLVSDYGGSNLGLRDGKIVMIDYGIRFEGVQDMPALNETIYNGIPLSVRKFDRDDTTLTEEIGEMKHRIDQFDVTLEDIQEAQRKAD